MKKTIIILGFILLSGFAWHKYYVSVTEVNIKKDKLEIIIRTFPDDIQNVLADTYQIKPNFDDIDMVSRRFLQLYVFEHFRLLVDEKEVNYAYSGFMTEDGFFIILLEAKIPENFSRLQIKNTLLMDMFEEQKNIVHFLEKNRKESAVLTKDNPIALYQRN